LDPTTTPALDDVARGIVHEIRPAEHLVVLGIPGTDYRLHLLLPDAVSAYPHLQPKARVRGWIDADARRIDVCGTGGAYIDPVYGRPRNLAGRIIARMPDKHALIIRAKVPFRIRVRPPQSPDDFADDQFVTFAVDRGATFTPLPPDA